ncbi:MAG TPA: 3'-5' exonuclease [Candidatus Polarisedimenticolaceae bacterium]
MSGWLDRLLARLRGGGDLAVLWSVDLETTGLNPRADRIVSVGMVPIRDGVIRYGERYHSLVRQDGVATEESEGLRIHEILPGSAAAAPTEREVLAEVDRRLGEGALLAHHAPLDVAFLREAYRRHGRPWPRPKVVDTIDLLLEAHRRRHRFTPHPPPPRTGLADAREALGLPPHDHHDALADALAAAELFLALRLTIRT